VVIGVAVIRNRLVVMRRDNRAHRLRRSKMAKNSRRGQRPLEREEQRHEQKEPDLRLGHCGEPTTGNWSAEAAFGSGVNVRWAQY
jgi:hypothetical protein